MSEDKMNMKWRTAAWCILLAAISWLAVPQVPGQVIVAYTSGVPAQASASGAADPAGQGWTYGSIPAGNYHEAFDSGNGGWRTVDGTGSFPASYEQTWTPEQLTLLAGPEWRLTWTVAMDRSALLSGGGGVTDYYLSPNNSRQNDGYVIVDVDDEYRLWLTHKLDANNQLLIDVDGGDTYATGVTITNNWPNFATFSLTYRPAEDSGTLDYGAGTATVTSSSTDPGRNKVFFGQGSSGGQGSLIWNEFRLVRTSGLVVLIR
jgi:hypothetical protein